MPAIGRRPAARKSWIGHFPRIEQALTSMEATNQIAAGWNGGHAELVAPSARDPNDKRSSPRGASAAPGFEPFLGWCVHGYTALGLVAAAMIAVLLVRGGSDAFRWSFLLMALATIVDSTDGTLARWVRIKEVVPGFDGRRLDDIIDFLNYTFLPILLVWRAGILPPGQEAWLLFPFCRASTGFARSRPRPMTASSLVFPRSGTWWRSIFTCCR